MDLKLDWTILSYICLLDFVCFVEGVKLEIADCPALSFVLVC